MYDQNYENTLRTDLAVTCRSFAATAMSDNQFTEPFLIDCAMKLAREILFDI